MKFGRLRRGDGGSGRAGSLTTGRDSLAETIKLLRRYLVQETIAPLKHIGRVLALGLAGALLYGAGGIFGIFAVLRLIQAESGSTFGGNWSFAPYLFAGIAGVLIFGAFAAIGLRGLRTQGAHQTDADREEP